MTFRALNHAHIAMEETKPLARPCAKCRAQEATLDSRSQAVCSDCFAKFISTKCIKQIAILGKETRVPGHGPPPPNTAATGDTTSARRYLVGLSLGVSSSVLLQLLNENIEFQLARGRNAPFELTIVHVDASSSLSLGSQQQQSDNAAEEILSKYRQRYPRFDFRCIPLSAALSLQTIDWTALTPLTLPDSHPSKSPAGRLSELFDNLPSAASRTDTLRLFIRHILISTSRLERCQALLLGHSTTALAELTLSETAKGRGFSLPWQINDGALPVVNYSSSIKTNSPEVPAATAAAAAETVLIYHPLQDVLRKELTTYATLTSPPLTALISDLQDKTIATSSSAVVSHKDLSIEEVMFRYFAEVEENYPSVVANVARTTGKLLRLDGTAGGENTTTWCGMCSMPLDEQGDKRWRGELGEEEKTTTTANGTAATGGRLCYGCERTTLG
ncbi:hypothetical protein B0H63DRAFT_261612 [Podospora didyma]|uniref:Cytoplasmic tRNA 2-thiolation protein 2 n=1 Tax=Podospora didyma TaxID=330526 RepID=A0AAE0KDP7_9PEZI|nr:hypothetical protein B0H63DRAFT_261612 [Podospora didyma]